MRRRVVASSTSSTRSRGDSTATARPPSTVAARASAAAGAETSPARAPAFALGLFLVTLVLRLALAAGGGGVAAWWTVFDPARSFEAPNEYLPALGALHWGPRFYLDRFAETVPALPVHAAGHPPGM